MSRTLRDALAPQLDHRWAAFARTHPHLAAAIDRLALDEVVVERVRDDPAFRRAMREADLDEATLLAATRALERARAVIDHAIRL